MSTYIVVKKSAVICSEPKLTSKIIGKYLEHEKFEVNQTTFHKGIIFGQVVGRGWVILKTQEGELAKLYVSPKPKPTASASVPISGTASIETRLDAIEARLNALESSE